MAVGVACNEDGYILEIVRVKRGTFGENVGAYDEEGAAPYTQIYPDGSYIRTANPDMWRVFLQGTKEGDIDFRAID